MSLKPVEFGIFLPVANNGWIMSKNSPQYMPTYALNKQICELAEEMGLHYVFSMAKWRGLGGETKFWNYTTEPLALTAALAAVTRRLRLVASVTPLLMHPAVVAKMASTIDDVANGRLGLNIVTAGNHEEYGQMDLYPEGFESYRYDYTEEWLEVARRLWTEDRVTFEGKYFTLRDCMCDPKPVQTPHPRIVCAIASDRGYQFVGERCDEAFIGGGTSVETTKINVQKVREAATRYGRSVKTQSHFNVIQGGTDQEAEDLVSYYREGRDVEAIAKVPFGDPQTRLFYGGLPLVGGPERIADLLAGLVIEAEIDGIMLVFPDFIEGLKKFRDGVLPLLASRGVELAPVPPA